MITKAQLQKIISYLVVCLFAVVVVGCSGNRALTSDCIKEPQLIQSVEPEYPRFARQAGLEGDVVLTYVVDKSGRVKDIKVIESNYSTFSEAAKSAVSQYKYLPATCYGQAFETQVTTTIEFRLT